MADRIKHAAYQFLTQVAYLLEYEPTWFPEFGFGFAAIAWGVCCFLTDDLVIRGWAWGMPVLGIVLGIVRCAVLLRLWYAARVVLSAISILFWSWIWWGLVAHFGAVPGLATLSGVILIDILTATKFTIPCLREIRDEYVAWHNAR